jgi:hypothetical protein
MKCATSRFQLKSAVLVSFAMIALSGCTTRPTFFANADPALRKSNAQFASDAAKRSYEADAPKGGNANGAAEVDYGIHRLSIVNSSSEDWNNVEIWLNQKYVIMIPQVPARAARAEMVNFESIYDHDGNYFPLDSSITRIETVEIFLDGKMYSLGQPRLAD